MALSNAERQRRWRKKQREQNYQQYLRKERVRKRGTYVPTSELSYEKQEARREKCRQDYKKYYIRKKKKLEEEKSTQKTAETRKSGNASSSRLLNIRLPCFGKAVGNRKRTKRALRKAYRDIDDLIRKVEEMQRDKKKLQKQILRERKRSSKNGEKLIIEKQSITPRSKAKLMLNKAGIKLDKRSPIHRQLVFGHAMVDAVKTSVTKKKTKRSINIEVGAQILKKYRCIRKLSKEFGVSRTKINTLHRPRVIKSIKDKYGEALKIFFEREDNSTLLPGKRDVKMRQKIPVQKRILNDYLANLHQKYLLENPDTKLSRSTFSRLRPPHVLLTHFSSRRTCLCSYHQNFALKIKSMRRDGLKCSANPDVFVKEFQNMETLKQTLSDTYEKAVTVRYKLWKKVLVDNKMRWKEVEECIDKDEFIKIVLENFEKFQMHVTRVKNQYSEMRKLRTNLPPKQVLIWMDFAENYNCTSVEEVQSAYWNSQMISLHTMVVYFPQDHCKKVQSYVAVSGNLSHNATVIYAILKKIVTLIKRRVS